MTTRTDSPHTAHTCAPAFLPLGLSLPGTTPSQIVVALIIALGIVGWVGIHQAYNKKAYCLFSGSCDLYLGALLGPLHLAGLVLIIGELNGWAKPLAIAGWGAFGLSLIGMCLMHRRVERGLSFGKQFVSFCARVLLLSLSAIASVLFMASVFHLKGAFSGKEERGTAGRAGAVLTAMMILAGVAALVKSLWDVICGTERSGGRGASMLGYGFICVASVLLVVLGAMKLDEHIRAEEGQQVQAPERVSQGKHPAG